MEDNSYVSLSLEKYNELYDKAKKYDEMQFEKVKKGMFDLFKDYGYTPKVNEESAATEEENSYYDVELIEEEDGIPAGAKGKRLELDDNRPYVDWDELYRGCYERRINGVVYKNVYAVHEENLKKLNEGEEK